MPLNPLVAIDVCRFTVNGTYLGRPTANVLDMVVLNNTNGPRQDVLDDVAGDIIDAWDSHILSWVNTGYEAVSVSYVDLDSEDGVTGVKTSTTDTTWPNNGASDGDPISGSIAALVTKQCPSARGQRNGRMFIAGLDESFVSGNLIDAGVAVGIQTELGDLLEELTETGVTADYEKFPTVVHTQIAGTPENPVLIYKGNTQITNFALNRRVASQRRRNRP